MAVRGDRRLSFRQDEPGLRGQDQILDGVLNHIAHAFEGQGHAGEVLSPPLSGGRVPPDGDDADTGIRGDAERLRDLFR